MTFSLRSILIVMAAIGAWLGAILSQSLLLVELATLTTNACLLLSVALAIWHPQREQRAFWTGFCLLGLGSFALGNWFAAYDQASSHLVNAFAGDETGAAISMPAGGSGWSGGAPPMAFPGYPTVPTAYANLGPPNYLDVVRLEAIRHSVPPIFSLLLAGIGGWMTVWIVRVKPDAAAKETVR